MDPKATGQLDPKLKEVYDRVMGVSTTPTTSGNNVSLASSPNMSSTSAVSAPSDTAIQSSPSAVNSTDPNTQQTTQVVTPPTLPVIPADPQITTSTPISVAPEMTTVENTMSAKPESFVAKSNEKSKISPVILAVGAIVFLIIYTIIWIKVFNVPVPYIN